MIRWVFQTLCRLGLHHWFLESITGFGLGGMDTIWICSSCAKRKRAWVEYISRWII